MGYTRNLCVLGGLFMLNLRLGGASNIMDTEDNWKNAKSVYEFDYVDIDGQPQSMKKFEGHPLIIVNVASNCSKTKPNYEQLTALYGKYSSPADGSKGLRIIGFPCNQFGDQEPGTEAEIKEFVKQFNVIFDLTSKVNVNGDDAHALWKYLKAQKGGSDIEWNFVKFLVDKNGQPLERFGVQTDPFEMEKDIQKLMSS